MRLVGKAKARGNAFEILGEPKGIFTPTISEGEVVDVEEEGVEEEGVPKRRRQSVVSAFVVSASVVSASAFPPSSSLPLKLASLVPFSIHTKIVPDIASHKVRWDKHLGSGSFGDVFAGIARGNAQHPVAIKVFTGRFHPEAFSSIRIGSLLRVAEPPTHRETSGRRSLLRYAEQRGPARCRAPWSGVWLGV